MCREEARAQLCVVASDNFAVKTGSEELAELRLTGWRCQYHVLASYLNQGPLSVQPIAGLRVACTNTER